MDEGIIHQCLTLIRQDVTRIQEDGSGQGAAGFSIKRICDLIEADSSRDHKAYYRAIAGRLTLDAEVANDLARKEALGAAVAVFTKMGS